MKGKAAEPYGRVTEWETSARDEGQHLRLFAWAQYGRGSRPKDAEIDRLEERVRLKFPTAELVNIHRTLIPCVGGGASRRVRWELQWIVWEDR